MSRKAKRMTPQRRLFNDEFHGATQIKNSIGILSQLYRYVMYEIGLAENEKAWNKYLNDYLKRFSQEHPERSANAERGNIRKAFTKPWMSWKTLLRALVFAKFKNVRVILEGKLEDGTPVRVVSKYIDLSGPISPISESENDEVDDTEPEYHEIPKTKPTKKGDK